MPKRFSSSDAEDYQRTVSATSPTLRSLSSKSVLNPKLLVKGIKLESKAEGLTNQIACGLHLAVAIKALVTEDEAVLMWPISMFTRTSVCSVCVPLVFWLAFHYRHLMLVIWSHGCQGWAKFWIYCKRWLLLTELGFN